MGHASCLRKCHACGYGFSNASTRQVEGLTIIYSDPFWNVPNFISAGHEEVLSHALNVVNQSSKRLKFMSRNSEDHVTWTVFRYLQLQNQLRQVLVEAKIPVHLTESEEPNMLLWGVPIPGSDQVGLGFRTRLTEVMDQLNEDLQSRSEPDVILDFGLTGLVQIEVKVGSSNETKSPEYSGWQRYLFQTEAFRDTGVAMESGLYELARNWRLAWELAGERPFAVVNLGPENLFTGKAGNQISAFGSSLTCSPLKQFFTLTWTNFLAAIPNQPLWFRSYLEDRGVK
jgi:hypothetical protein